MFLRVHVLPNVSKVTRQSTIVERAPACEKVRETDVSRCIRNKTYHDGNSEALTSLENIPPHVEVESACSSVGNTNKRAKRKQPARYLGASRCKRPVGGHNTRCETPCEHDHSTV